jgi:SAM-dependent methyltransferase
MNEAELQAMIRTDERHWWFRGRRRIVLAVIRRLALPADGSTRILDAGCGSGRTLDDLRAFGAVVGIDATPECVAATRARGHDVVEAPVESLPFEDATFDLVTCLDVLEHTEDDIQAARELRRVARPGGYVLVTVPAYPRLWSVHDETHGHHRRYRRPDLRRVARAAGLEVARESSFNTFLLPVAALVRWGRRHVIRRETGRSELELTPRALDAVLGFPLYLESRLLARGLSLPAGLSHLAVLRRPA